MTTRSRQGCDECRRRRRKCDEKKPVCGQCCSFGRTCRYTLRVVSVWQQQQGHNGENARRDDQHNKIKCPSQGGDVLGRRPTIVLPRQLPNGIPLSPRHRQLLHHFTQDILASLSCHPLVHQDLRQGLLPATLHSPQLMSACLALSAAGFLSRGVVSLDGADVAKILGHLQSSGLGLLRSALAENGGHGARGHRETNETLLATCLIWCLTDVFTYNPAVPSPSSSWRIHLQGIQALLDDNNHNIIANDQTDTIAPLATNVSRERASSGSDMQMAMRHLYQLYLSLQTLPYIPRGLGPERQPTTSDETNVLRSVPSTSPAIDGFLGYSDELLPILHRINQLARSSSSSCPESDILLGKVKAMISRDSRAPPPVTLSPVTISDQTPTGKASQLQEYALCHRIFQQATLIQLYRQLYRHPSSSSEIQAAFSQIVLLFSQMESTSSSSGGCHTWVAMAMPLFTLGCEAVTEDQRNFVMAKISGLEECIRSSHVRIIRRALRDVWNLRVEMGDEAGDLCAGDLLEKLDYNIILF